MGVALADDDDPGFFRDRTAPKKWSFFERSKESDHKTERFVYMILSLRAQKKKELRTLAADFLSR